jgi:hypothetical protein
VVSAWWEDLLTTLLEYCSEYNPNPYPCRTSGLPMERYLLKCQFDTQTTPIISSCSGNYSVTYLMRFCSGLGPWHISPSDLHALRALPLTSASHGLDILGVLATLLRHGDPSTSKPTLTPSRLEIHSQTGMKASSVDASTRGCHQRDRSEAIGPRPYWHYKSLRLVQPDRQRLDLH